MKNAPLIYTIGMVKFPRIPDFERFTNEFMELIRKEYPLDDQFEAQIFNAQISSSGIAIEPQKTRLWQFASIDQKWGFVLNEQALFLHTPHYHDFAGFAKRFKAGIAALIKIDKINISWMSSIGIRYVNMIAPLGEAVLEEYLKPWVLPSDIHDPSLTLIQGVYSVRYKTKCGELRLQSLRNPTFTLPPELNSPFITKNGWVQNKPTSEFALVDIDHCSTWESPLKFDVSLAIKELGDLREISRMIFDSIGTESAISAWER